MVKLSLNLRSKKSFFVLSFFGLMYLIVQINKITSSIDIKGFDIVVFFLIIIYTAGMFWIPYYFNDKFL